MLAYKYKFRNTVSQSDRAWKVLWVVFHFAKLLLFLLSTQIMHLANKGLQKTP